jgi:hypothetical protein
LVTASGGVQIDPWSVVARSEVVADLASATVIARQASADQWWWN